MGDVSGIDPLPFEHNIKALEGSDGGEDIPSEEAGIILLVDKSWVLTTGVVLVAVEPLADIIVYIIVYVLEEGTGLYDDPIIAVGGSDHRLNADLGE